LINYELDASQFTDLDKWLDEDVREEDEKLRTDGIFSGSTSPRHEFARRLVDSGRTGSLLLPEPIILRDRFSEELDLSNFEIGDAHISLLSEVCVRCCQPSVAPRATIALTSPTPTVRISPFLYVGA
jgi:hypothetical protein